MAEFKVKTKGGANPQGKPRVYFTCHPQDFDKYFEKLCADIFKTHQCAIYYTEDMTAVIEEQDKATDLGSHNLFIVPVTFKLLSQPNRAMDEDIPYALQQHIPVLPFMMEPGIDAVYSRPDRFGELQYLNPYSTDLTEISYEEKLKKYLEAVLISDETAKKVREAFDAYIFLSYRKKDRRYANELMKLIHSHPEFRDIAIWYDEFLTPGESFRDGIDKMLADSDLFALLVTPNLLEEPEGRPNFVMGEEYPAAKKSGIGILPTEMEDTNKAALGKKFDGIPACVKPEDADFKPRLMEYVAKIAAADNDDDPMHNYLIGLAYLEGIDVETDRARGLALITKAAEADLPEAMVRLCDMFWEGDGVALDYQNALKWAERLYSYSRGHLGEAHQFTIECLSNLAAVYGRKDDYHKKLELSKKVYDLSYRTLGDRNPTTLKYLCNLALAYAQVKFYKKAYEIAEKAYSLQRCVLGEEDPQTVFSLDLMAMACMTMGDNKKARELCKRVYILRCQILGEEDDDTIKSLEKLMKAYDSSGEQEKATELCKQLYDVRCRVLGGEHEDTLDTMDDLVLFYIEQDNNDELLKLYQKRYSIQCRTMGEKDINTLATMHDIARTYYYLGNYQMALAVCEEAYGLQVSVLGENHNSTRDTQQTLGRIRKALKKANSLSEGLRQALSQIEIRYDGLCQSLGKEHPETQKVWEALQLVYRNFGVCHHCGGDFDEQQKCLKCGKPKDY